MVGTWRRLSAPVRILTLPTVSAGSSQFQGAGSPPIIATREIQFRACTIADQFEKEPLTPNGDSRHDYPRQFDRHSRSSRHSGGRFLGPFPGRSDPVALPRWTSIPKEAR